MEEALIAVFSVYLGVSILGLVTGGFLGIVIRLFGHGRGTAYKGIK